MHLFVIGPAFGLPSIDVECIAAIALLKSTFGNSPSKWTLSPCYTHITDLPLLLDDGRSIHGFDSIARHLKSYGGEKLPHPEDASQQAHGIAITALLQSRAPLLISTYLYVSSENYSRVTRGAFTPILSPLARFLVPTFIRSAARDSTAHLGISTVDVDTTHDDRRLDGVDSSFEAASRHKASLILPAKTSIQDLLARKAEGKATFKLHALADSLFEPLQDMLGDKQWLLDSDGPGYLDCLAYGYLSIIYETEMPSTWLLTILKDRYPSLAAYTTRMRDALGVQTELSDLQGREILNDAKATAKSNLPWTESPSRAPGESNSLSQLLRFLLPSFQPASVVPEAEVSRLNLVSYSTGGAIASLLLTSLIGGAWLLRNLWGIQHGQPVQVFGRKPVTNLGHVSQALAGLTVVPQARRHTDSLDITPSNAEHPLSETVVEL